MAESLGRYEVIRKLGEGAMGEVLLARDTLLGREVALKTIRSGERDAEVRARFFREAQAAGRLTHPHAVTVHDFGEAEGRVYLAMEYVPGEDLSVLLRAGSLTAGEILEALAQVSEALGAAHGLGMVHRDVKPSNIRVQRLGERLHAKLMDFGIARLSGSDLTATGVVLGTFGYMAPEYLQSGQAEAKADLFALGVILHEALTGQNPFHGDTTGTVIYRILHEEPLPVPGDRMAGLSPSVQRILDRLLEKDPARRLGSASALASALRGCLDPQWHWVEGGEPTLRSTRKALLALPDPLPARTSRPYWLLASGGCLAVALGWVALRESQVERASPPTVTEEMPPGSSTTPMPEVSGPPVVPAALGEPEARRGVGAPRVSGPREAPGPPASQDRPSGLDVERLLDADPAEALVRIERHLSRQPGDTQAMALRLVALQKLGRMPAVHRGLRELRARGVSIRQLAREVPRFGRMLEEGLAAGTLRMPKSGDPSDRFGRGGRPRLKAP